VPLNPTHSLTELLPVRLVPPKVDFVGIFGVGPIQAGCRFFHMLKSHFISINYTRSSDCNCKNSRYWQFWDQLSFELMTDIIIVIMLVVNVIITILVITCKHCGQRMVMCGTDTVDRQGD